MDTPAYIGMRGRIKKVKFIISGLRIRDWGVESTILLNYVCRKQAENKNGEKLNEDL